MKKIKYWIFVFCLTISCIVTAEDYVSASVSEYILPESDSRYLGYDDISNLTVQGLCYARNEIYARHGRKFLSAELTEYFNSTTWYQGVYEPESFPNDCLNEYEKENVQILLNQEMALCPGRYVLEQPGYQDTWSDLITVDRIANDTHTIETNKDYDNVTSPTNYRSYAELLSNGVYLESTWGEGSIYPAQYYYLFDMTNDGKDELLVWVKDDNYEYHWKIFSCDSDGTVYQLYQNQMSEIGNAGHGLGILNGNCLVETAGRWLVGYDAEWLNYLYFQNGRIEDLVYLNYTDREFSGSEIISEETTHTYTLNGMEIPLTEGTAILAEYNEDDVLFFQTDRDPGSILITAESIHQLADMGAGEGSCISNVSDDVIQSMQNGEIVSLGSFATLDLNSDGLLEQFSIGPDPWNERHPLEEEGYLMYYLLQVDDLQYSGYGENVIRNLYGVSLDGKNILLIVYEEGPSADPVSHFYAYDGFELEEIGCICDTPEDMIVNDYGELTGIERCNVMDTSLVKKSWGINEFGLIEQIEQDYYEMYTYAHYYGGEKEYYAYLNEEISVYEDMNTESEMYIMQPQAVYFPYTDGYDWVYVQGEDGSGGWLQVGWMSHEEKNIMFSGLFYAG